MKKYELVEQNGQYHVRALRDVANVLAGAIGGVVSGEHNLSQDGGCWIYANARVYGDARVSDNARIYGNARVCGRARVHGDASVHGESRIYGDAQVYGEAQISGEAMVYGNSKVLGNARVYGDAMVNGNAEIRGIAQMSGGDITSGVLAGATRMCHGLVTGGLWMDTWVPAVCGGILGQTASVSAPGMLAVGCQVHPIGSWLNPQFASDLLREHLKCNVMGVDWSLCLNILTFLSQVDNHLRYTGELKPWPSES